MKDTFRFRLNNKPVQITTDGDRTLLWVLRTDLETTGPKYGCGEGECGACIVLIDNEAVPSCQISVQDVDSSEIITIEGLAKNGTLHPLQEAFIEHDALQCGFCTPGMILKASTLLAKNATLTRKEIVAEMDDNLCRCGAHKRILDAIEAVVRNKKGGMA
jgi:carbon-monoxide dehydrogenase small subunit